jgi:gamma-glutamyltranspeptidase/glutathione hydrolase
VRRGIPRVTPGTPLPAAAPIAIVQRSGGFAAAVGLPGEAAIDVGALRGIAAGPSIQAALAEVCARASARTAIAVVRDARAARAIVVFPSAEGADPAPR